MADPHFSPLNFDSPGNVDPGGLRLVGSQPMLPQHDLRRLVILRRQQPSASQPSGPANRDPSEAQALTQVQLRKDVFDRIYSAMEEMDLPMKLVNQNLVQFLLPTSKADYASWKKLLETPMLVTDAELRSMFVLRKCTSQTPPADASQVLFYLRSMAFQVHELNNVIEYLESNGVLLRKAAAWRNAMKGLSPSSIIFLRYVGQTTKSAHSRHTQDLAAKQKTEAISVFQATRLLYPEIVDEINVFQFVKGTLPVYILGIDDLSDMREQATIALLDLNTLLNTQPGGKKPSFIPAHLEDIEIMFNKLAVRPLNRFDNHTTPCSQSVLDQLATYVETVQQYANENPQTTGTHASSFTDQYRNAVLKQITPVTIKKTPYMPFVMIGQDPTIEMFQGGKTILETNSTVKHLLIQTIDMLGQREGKAAGITKKLFEQHRIPFIDLFPWNKKSPRDLDVVMDRMRFYLQVTNPLVVLAFGEQVSSVARGDFVHPHGLRHGALQNHIGQLVIRNYSDPEAPDDEKCVIVIPCYHPGIIRYGHFRGAADFAEIFTLTMIVAWTAAYYGMRFSEECVQRQMSKKKFLEAIIRATNEKLGPGSSFMNMFVDARNDYKTWARRTNTAGAGSGGKSTGGGRGTVQANIRDSDRSWGRVIERQPFDKLKIEVDQMQTHDAESDIQIRAERWESAQLEVEMIMQCGWAMYESQSAEANQQARDLATKHYATLQTQKTGTTVSEVFQWAANFVQRKNFYYFEAADDSDRRWDIPNLLTIFASEDIDIRANIDWADDPQALSTASTKTQKWFEQKVLDSTIKPEIAVQSGLKALSALMFKKDPDLAVVQRALMGRDLKAAPKVHKDPKASLEGVQVDVIAWRNDKISAALVLNWVDDSSRQWTLTGHSRDKSEICLPPVCMTTSHKDTRHIHFVQDGIDIRTKAGRPLKAEGTSCTVPLSQIRLMLKGEVQKAFIKLWEKETRLNSDEAEFEIEETEQDASELSGPFYPATAFQPGPKQRKNRKLDVGSRGTTINEKKQIENIKGYLPLQAGDALWLLHKFLQEQYPNAGRVDASNPNVFPNVDSLWARLSDFCKKPMYQHHPMRQHLEDIASLALEERNTAGCETMLKLAVEQFLRPGSSRERKQIWFPDLKKKKWGIWYDLSANGPSTRTLPSSVRPQLEHNQIIQTVSGDVVEVDDEEEVQVPASDAVDESVDMYSQEANEARSRALAQVRVPKRPASKSPSPAREAFSSSFVKDSQSSTARNVAQGDPVEPEWDEMLLDRYG